MMKRVSVVCVAILLMASIASASTVWNPAANGIYPPDAGDWGVAANWTNGVPDAVEKAVFNVGGAAEAWVSDAQSGAQVVQGDGDDGGVLRIVSGGILTTKAGAWSAVGYDNTAHTIVETGGTYNFSQHAWIGLNDGAVGTLDINGGTVTVGSMLGLGWSDDILATSQGFVNVNDGGLLALSNIHGDGSTSVKHGSLLSINGTGRITIANNFVGVFEAYATAGLMAGDGTLGNVVATFDEGANLTTVVVPEPVSMLLLGLGGLLIRKRR